VNRRNFKDILASFGPDRPRTPAQSREARLAKVAPPIVAEVLEVRRHFTLTLSLNSGVLTVTGTSGADSIAITDDGTNYHVLDEGSLVNSYARQNVSSLIVWGGSGNDTIDLAGTGDPFQFVDLPSNVYGQDGNDLIYGGGSLASDTLTGGNGYDTIYGNGGADLIYGGTGSGDSSDSVNGNDSLFGGAGNDLIYGEGGADAIYGETGADTLYGGDGNDTIHAGDQNFVTDYLIGGNGTDCGFWFNEDSTNTMEGNLNPNP
jgi:Ca2+-binding RTX toxin-like protein